MNVRENIDIGKPDKIASLAMLAQAAPQLVNAFLIASTIGLTVAIWWLWSYLNLMATLLCILLLFLTAWKIVHTKINQIQAVRKGKITLAMEEAKLEKLQTQNDRDRARADFERYVLPQLAETAIRSGLNVRYSAKGDLEISDWRSNLHSLAMPDQGKTPLLTQGTLPDGLVTLSSMMDSDQLRKGDDEWLIGMTVEGPLYGKLFVKTGCIANSIYVCGDPDQGKSTLGVYLGVLTIMAGGKIVVIDPQSELDQSLTSRLGPLVHPSFMLAPIAGTPSQAEYTIQVIEAEMKKNDGTPLLILVDEFSVINSGYGEWAEVGPSIYGCCKNVAVAGRKIQKRVVTFGQIPNGSSSGGTEFRNVCSVAGFHMKEKAGQLLFPETERKIASHMGKGEIVLMTALGQCHHIKLVYPDSEGLDRIVEEYGSSSNYPDYCFETTSEQMELEPVNNEKVLRAIRDKVIELHKAGVNQTDIIKQIWGVSKGRSSAYATARDQYLSIITSNHIEESED